MLNFEKHKILYAEEVWGSRHITMPNFLKTGPSTAEILRFFDFPNGCRCHLGFLKSQNFIG